MSDSKPVFKIERTDFVNIGRCYNSESFLISSDKKVSKNTIKELFKMNIFGCGQECRITSVCDGTEKKSTTSNCFEYECVVLCDSSD